MSRCCDVPAAITPAAEAPSTAPCGAVGVRTVRTDEQTDTQSIIGTDKQKDEKPHKWTYMQYKQRNKTTTTTTTTTNKQHNIKTNKQNSNSNRTTACLRGRPSIRLFVVSPPLPAVVADAAVGGGTVPARPCAVRWRTEWRAHPCRADC